MGISDKNSLPVSICVASASPHEVTLVGDTIAERFIRQIPGLLVADRAYDSDPLDAALKQQGIRLIAPHRGGRKKPKIQDGRELRRYLRRWKAERLFAWLQNYRRVVTRYEYKPENFLAFTRLACMLLLLKHFW